MKRTIPKRIHIIGSIGSGKTTLAKILSTQLHIPYFELDNVVWERFDTGDNRRSDEERDNYLNAIINADSWIIEGVHHKWVSSSFQNADNIIFLDTKLSTRRFRIIKRFFMQKIGLEKANYKPTIKILKDLYNYNTVFDFKSKPEIFDMLSLYDSKLIVLNSNTKIRNYISRER